MAYKICNHSRLDIYSYPWMGCFGRLCCAPNQEHYGWRREIARIRRLGCGFSAWDYGFCGWADLQRATDFVKLL
jgi:hypothetical protein